MKGGLNVECPKYCACAELPKDVTLTTKRMLSVEKKGGGGDGLRCFELRGELTLAWASTNGISIAPHNNVSFLFALNKELAKFLGLDTLDLAFWPLRQEEKEEQRNVIRVCLTHTCCKAFLKP